MRQSRQTHDRFENAEIARVLGKMEVSAANLVYNIHMNTETNVIHEFDTSMFARGQRLLEYNLSGLEVQEIALIAELGKMCSGSLVYDATAINTYHGLYDVVQTQSESNWFHDCELELGEMCNEENDLKVHNAANDNLSANLSTNMYILHLNTNADTLWDVDNNVALTPVTGSNVPLRWDLKLCDTLSKSTHINLGGTLYSLLTIRASANLCVTHITELADKPNVRVLRGKTKIKVLLPTVDINSVAHTLGIVGTKWQYHEVDTELTYRILVNGITGKKSVSALLTYIAGLTATR
jgi:hypothetical protein